MAVYNLGSINLDHVYQVRHLPAPGETLTADAYSVGLGGKGANQSVASARAGAQTFHIGSVGAEGDWAVSELVRYGVDTRHILRGAVPSGHAIINVDAQAENTIILFAGANRAITETQVGAALAHATAADSILMQNETSVQAETARLAASKGMRVVYSAAPFEIEAVRLVLAHVSLLVMNEVEAAQLRAELGALPEMDVIITKGAQGAEWISRGTEPLFVPAFRVEPVDTTGAGDTFIGTLVAALDAGLDRPAAMRRASAASAIQVTRAGAAQAIPTAAEVDAFLR